MLILREDTLGDDDDDDSVVVVVVGCAVVAVRLCCRMVELTRESLLVMLKGHLLAVAGSFVGVAAAAAAAFGVMCE